MQGAVSKDEVWCQKRQNFQTICTMLSPRAFRVLGHQRVGYSAVLVANRRKETKYLLRTQSG